MEEKKKNVVNNLVLIIAVLIGFGSLLLFWLFLFGYSFTLEQLNYNKIEIFAWDFLLCLIFFIQHSVMVRKSFRSKLLTVVPRRFHGALYTVASGISLFVLVLFWQNIDYSLIIINDVFRWIMNGIFMASMVGIIWSFKVLSSFDMLGIRPIINNIDSKRSQTSQLMIKGPYKIVRHPLYSFILLQIWLRPDITIDRLLFDILFTIWIVLGSYLEERDMVAEFGKSYKDYQSKVSMLIPWKLLK